MVKISKNWIKKLGKPTNRPTDPTNHKQTGMSNKMNNPYYLNQ